MVPGSPAHTTARANAPRSSRTVARTASASEAPAVELLLDQVRDDLGVGVGGEGVPVGARAAPAAPGQFSMIPLWTTATRAGAVDVGVGVGLGGVAVGRPAGVADAGDHAVGGVVDHLDQVLERPGAGRRPRPPQRPVAPVGLRGPPRPSRTPGTRGARGPRGAGRRTLSPPVAPMMPHMGPRLRRRAAAGAAPPPRSGRRRAGAGPATRAHHLGQARRPPCRAALLVGGLDHDPHQGLGPAGPQQHPARAPRARPRPRPGLGRTDRRVDRGRRVRATATLTRTWGRRRIERPPPARPAAARCAGRGRASSTPVRMPSPGGGQLAEDDVARLLARRGSSPSASSASST